jgi:hypothetical protein
MEQLGARQMAGVEPAANRRGRSKKPGRCGSGRGLGASPENSGKSSPKARRF